MNIIDISWPISPEITEYKNKKTVRIEQVKTFDVDGVRESIIQLGSHTGTHIDAPAHFLQNGAYSDQLALDACIGPCVVLDCSGLQKITAADLERHEIKSSMIVLFKTDNSNCLPTDSFNANFVYLDASGADYLVRKQIKSVGIDYLGIERNQSAHETHVVLMQAGIPIIEGLRLAHVQADAYQLICLPLNIEHVEAMPARAILMR